VLTGRKKSVAVRGFSYCRPGVQVRWEKNKKMAGRQAKFVVCRPLHEALYAPKMLGFFGLPRLESSGYGLTLALSVAVAPLSRDKHT
jgi:hypothetical protein